MPAAALAALLLVVSAWAQAQSDPLRSPACLSAVQRLSAAEDRSRESLASARAAVPAPARDEPLQAARREVARVCLGAAELVPPPARARAPVAVEGLGSGLRSNRAPGSTAPPAATGPAAPPLRVPAVLSLTSCDAAGCWASDGTRLQRQGTLLLGPRGYCSVLGTVLSCP